MPHIASAARAPVTFHPVRVGVGRTLVVAGDPDVAVTVPAVVARVPGPVAVLRGRHGDDLNGARRRRPNADDDLRSGNGSAGGKNKTGNGGKNLLHVQLLSVRSVGRELVRADASLTAKVVLCRRNT
jgi:hypothetical protein